MHTSEERHDLAPIEAGRCDEAPAAEQLAEDQPEAVTLALAEPPAELAAEDAIWADLAGLKR